MNYSKVNYSCVTLIQRYESRIQDGDVRRLTRSARRRFVNNHWEAVLVVTKPPRPTQNSMNSEERVVNEIVSGMIDMLVFEFWRCVGSWRRRIIGQITRRVVRT